MQYEREMIFTTSFDCCERIKNQCIHSLMMHDSFLDIYCDIFKLLQQLLL